MKLYKIAHELKHISNVKIGDEMLRRDSNHGEKDKWEKFIVNWTYLELMQQFPEDYKYLDGNELTVIEVI